MKNDDTKRGLFATFALLLTIAAIFLLGGCKTVYVDRPVVHTEYIHDTRVDSVNLHDSIFIKEVVKGDTVTRIEYRYRDRFRYVYATDTLIQRDTVSVVVEKVVVKTENKLTQMQTFFLVFGKIGILILIAWFVFKLVKRKFSF